MAVTAAVSATRVVLVMQCRMKHFFILCSGFEVFVLLWINNTASCQCNEPQGIIDALSFHASLDSRMEKMATLMNKIYFSKFGRRPINR